MANKPGENDTVSAQTIVLGGLRLTSVRVGPVWALFDDKLGRLPNSMGDRADIGKVQWLVLPDGKRLMAVAQFRASDGAKSTDYDGISLLVVGPDRHVQR